MFLSGGLEDTAACEVSLVSVLLHELSLFMFRGDSSTLCYTPCL